MLREIQITVRKTTADSIPDYLLLNFHSLARYLCGLGTNFENFATITGIKYFSPTLTFTISLADQDDQDHPGDVRASRQRRGGDQGCGRHRRRPRSRGQKDPGRI